MVGPVRRSSAVGRPTRRRPGTRSARPDPPPRGPAAGGGDGAGGGGGEQREQADRGERPVAEVDRRRPGAMARLALRGRSQAPAEGAPADLPHRQRHPELRVVRRAAVGSAAAG